MENDRIVSVWEPISFNDNWLTSNTSKLDELSPSWLSKRANLKEGSNEYEEFINRLKRQHAIETGIIEKLYDLKEGITQTFIKEGFVESYLQHGDTNIPSNKLISYLKDHFDAIDFVFSVVKQDRPISKGFILELHQLITQHQETTDAINQFGDSVKVSLLRGVFKKHDNNPRRADGTIFLYCPPIHVDFEIENLISIYNQLEDSNVKPVIISAWFHHAFTQIHPFQDGNGRLARLLASLILIKHGLFPLTVKGSEKKKYIDSLEFADRGEPQQLVEFFCEVEKRNIEAALNLRLEIPQTNSSLKEVAEVLNNKLLNWKLNKQKERLDKINTNRNNVFEFCKTALNDILINELWYKIDEETARITLYDSLPNSYNYFYYSHQIIDYANVHDYFFNRTLPRGWFSFKFVFEDDKEYHLVISIHHFGYDNSTLAIGAFLEFSKDGEVVQNPDSSLKRNDFFTSTPIDIKPHIISLDANIEDLKQNIKTYLNDTVTVGLAQIISELG
jgi:Fic family protein